MRIVPGYFDYASKHDWVTFPINIDFLKRNELCVKDIGASVGKTPK